VRFHRRLWFVTVTAVVVYLTWVFGSRWWYARQVERRAERRVSPLPAELTGSDLKILHFYVNPAMAPPGGRALLCYGVLNAATVAVSPPVGDLKPSLSRCIEVRPARTTEYRLTAQGVGQVATAAATIEVKTLRE
jgi:hypothetical protein